MAWETKLQLGDLSEEMLENILSRLTLADSMHCRLVSSEWNRILSSTTFIVQSSAGGTPQCQPWLLLYDQKITTFVLYNPQTKRWHFKNSEIIPRTLLRPSEFPFSQLGMENTSARGLIFMYEHSLGTILRIRVCNPLTEAARMLPQLVLPRTSLSTMNAIDDPRDPSHYKLAVTGYKYHLQSDSQSDTAYINGEHYPYSTSPGQQLLEIYESITDSWRRATDPPGQLGSGISSLRSVGRFRNNGKFVFVSKGQKYQATPKFLEWNDNRQRFVEYNHMDNSCAGRRARHFEAMKGFDEKAEFLRQLNYGQDPEYCSPNTVLRASMSVVRRNGEMSRSPQTCLAVRSLRCFPIADDGGAAGDQLICVSSATQKIACFSFKEPLSESSRTSISHPALLMQQELAQHKPGATPGRARSRWQELGAVTSILSSEQLGGTCFTPRLDIVL